MQSRSVAAVPKTSQILTGVVDTTCLSANGEGLGVQDIAKIRELDKLG